jgi:hypothetical protein
MARSACLLTVFIGSLSIVSSINVGMLPANTTDTVTLDTISKSMQINATCVSNEDCSNHGQCVNNTVCHCDPGWTTFSRTINESKSCSYEQHSKKKALFLSLFAGFVGADWFYLSRNKLGYIMTGILKLLIACICCCSWPLASFLPKIKDSEEFQRKIRTISSCLSLIGLSWWVVDWARILANKFPDGNNVNLMPW